MAIPSYLGQVHRADGSVEGTCFQVAPGVLVTAWHVLEAHGAHQPESVVAISQLTGGEQFEATVLRTDPRHDLAVLTSDGHLAGSAKALGVSSEVRLGARIEVGGAAEVDGDPSVTVLEGAGTWQGQVIRDDAVQLNSVACNRVTPRMSGSPVRLPGDVVIGVVSGRYNSESAWLADAVWTASTEALEELLRDVAGAPAVQRSLLGSITDVVLTIESDSVRLSWDQIVVNGRHSGSTLALRAALDDADRARRLAKLPVREGASPEVVAPASTISAMRVLGKRMAACFLPGTVGQRLADLLSRAAQEHAQIRLAVEADGRWGLPWEAMIPPGAIESLAMLPQVTVYRRSPAQSEARKLPGPLTIAVAIAAPTRSGGPILDYERELRNVLAAVAGARHSRRGIAQIRIIPFATLAALRSALEAGDVHVLHLSGHGTPGAIVLEDDDGSAVQVSAEQLIAEAVPHGMMPPLISLAACHTNAQGSAAERSFAADLAAHGARAVIATENSITDRYATAFFAQVYASLARSNDTDVVNAVSAARCAVQTALMSSTVAADQQLSAMEEWALVTVLTPSAPSPVLDTSAPSRPPDARSEQRLETTTQRRVGEFVGRRGLQRDLPPLLIASDLENARPGGVLLHGLGGIGKTTLASELVRRVGERAGDVIVAEVYGEVAADALLQAVGPGWRQRGVRGRLRAAAESW